MSIAGGHVAARKQVVVGRSRPFYLAMVVVLGGVLLGSRLVEPSWLPSFCLFNMMTGLPCPSCGMTRAFHAISLGHFREATMYHSLGLLFYGLTIFHFIVACCRFLGWRSRLLRMQDPVRVMAYGTLGLLLVYWVPRLLGLIP